jgi:hypothetical protein
MSEQLTRGEWAESVLHPLEIVNVKRRDGRTTRVETKHVGGEEQTLDTIRGADGMNI